jgi:hypothetical protein
MTTRCAIACWLSIASVLATAGCKQKAPVPREVSVTAERFERAVLYGDCAGAWGTLTEARRLARLQKLCTMGRSPTLAT